MPRLSNQIKTSLLGMSIGTASGRLRKSLLFMFVKKCGMDLCHRCGTRIETEVDLSIEHKDAWQIAADPVAAFFDLDNISFSHFLCNVKAGRRPHKKFNNPGDRLRSWRLSRKNGELSRQGAADAC